MAASFGVQFVVIAIVLGLAAPAASDSCNSGKLRIKLEYLERKILEMKTDFDRNQRRIEQSLEKILETLTKDTTASEQSTERPEKFDFPLNCSQLKSMEKDYDCQPFETCSEAKQINFPSGKYLLELPEDKKKKSFIGYCDQNISDGAWLVIQSRVDGSLSFEKNWDSYVRGFGQSTDNYWIGLDKLHLLTTNQRYELRIELENDSGTRKYAAYDEFVVGSASEHYKLKKLGSFSGTAGDSMGYDVGVGFSTFDSDHDESEDNCAFETRGGWWLRGCKGANYCNLNGVHGGPYWQAIEWWTFSKSYTGLKRSRMLIRAK